MVVMVGLEDVDTSFASEWSDLFERALDPYPYMDPVAYLTGSARHTSMSSCKFLAAYDGDRLVGLMPVSIQRPFERWPVRAFTNRSPFLDLESVWHHPLLDPRCPALALELLIQGGVGHGMPQLVDLVVFPGDGAVADAFMDAARRCRWQLALRDQHLGVLTRRASVGEVAPVTSDDTPDISLPYASGRARRLYARTLRELEASVGPVRASEEGADPSSIRRFLDLQNRGWKGDQSRGGNAYRRAGLEEWFLAYTDALRGAGRLRVTALRAGDKTIHIGIQARVGDRVFGVADAFDEEYAALGPGTLGRIIAMKSALSEEGVTLFDPNMGARYSESHSARIYPDRRPRNRYLIGTGALSRALVRGQPSLRALRDRASAIARRR